MSLFRVFGWFVALAIVSAPAAAQAKHHQEVDPSALLKASVNRWLDLVEPSKDDPAERVTIKAKLTKAEGLPKELADATVDVVYQFPDHLRVAAVAGKDAVTVARDGQQLWVYVPMKKFGVLGKAGVIRFKQDPTTIDTTVLSDFGLPISRFKIKAFMLLVKAELVGFEKVGETDCPVIKATLRPTAAEMIGTDTNVVLQFWIRQADLMPLRVTVTDGQHTVQVDTVEATVKPVPKDDFFKFQPADGDHIETVALSHLTKLLEVGPALMNQQIATLGPATGKVRTLGRSGNGRLEDRDGTRVLFLKGSAQEMGTQHGELLRDEIGDVKDKILYGIGVGSSFARGSWFFGDIENAQARLTPFIDSRVLREMDAMSAAAGLHQQEGRLSNFFPELFHCTGFALLPKSTADGHLYHGRVLDYLRGVGLEQNAVVIVHQPNDGRLAWVNLSYAGFIGSISAMNEKGISIGEMGGNGAGQWDGKPMAQLMREVMEKATTLDEAVAIMKAGPRTCEYYYVIADGKSKQAVGIGATPDRFELVQPGEAHPRLPNPSPDTVLLSAGDRYDLLSKRVKANWGKFDADTARDLMTRPVCMTSNIQSVLFVPDTLDFYVANADGKNVASHTRYTKYNLNELLKP